MHALTTTITLTIAYDRRLLVNLLMAKSFPEAWPAQRPGLGPGPAQGQGLGPVKGQGPRLTSFPYGDGGFVMKAVAANHTLATLYTRKQVLSYS